VTRRKLYALLFTACAAGALCLAAQAFVPRMPRLCLFHHLTGLACPACGTTRALLLLLQGDFAGAARLNPLAYPAALMLGLLPVVLVLDRLSGTGLLLGLWQGMETQLRRPLVALPLSLLLLANWGWSIQKGL
jgi:hypothetical protein